MDVPDVFLWDGAALVEKRQIWLANREKPVQPIPSPYKYDRVRAVVSAVKDVIAKAEVRRVAAHANRCGRLITLES